MDSCMQYHLFFKTKIPFAKAIRNQSGPDDSLQACLNQIPHSFLILDQTGPIFYANPDSKAKDRYTTAHILIGIELVTYRVNIVVINDMSVVSIIKGLECLQNLRGCLLNSIFDAHKIHMPMTRQTDDT